MFDVGWADVFGKDDERGLSVHHFGLGGPLLLVVLQPPGVGVAGTTVGVAGRRVRRRRTDVDAGGRLELDDGGRLSHPLLRQVLRRMC